MVNVLENEIVELVLVVLLFHMEADFALVVAQGVNERLIFHKVVDRGQNHIIILHHVPLRILLR